MLSSVSRPRSVCLTSAPEPFGRPLYPSLLMLLFSCSLLPNPRVLPPFFPTLSTIVIPETEFMPLLLQQNRAAFPSSNPKQGVVLKNLYEVSVSWRVAGCRVDRCMLRIFMGIARSDVRLDMRECALNKPIVLTLTACPSIALSRSPAVTNDTPKRPHLHKTYSFDLLRHHLDLTYGTRSPLNASTRS